MESTAPVTYCRTNRVNSITENPWYILPLPTPNLAASCIVFSGMSLLLTAAAIFHVHLKIHFSLKSLKCNFYILEIYMRNLKRLLMLLQVPTSTCMVLVRITSSYIDDHARGLTTSAWSSSNILTMLAIDTTVLFMILGHLKHVTNKIIDMKTRSLNFHTWTCQVLYTFLSIHINYYPPSYITPYILYCPALGIIIPRRDNKHHSTRTSWTGKYSLDISQTSKFMMFEIFKNLEIIFLGFWKTRDDLDNIFHTLCRYLHPHLLSTHIPTNTIFPRPRY